LAAALEEWTPDMAVRNHRMALARLDWRWRFKVIADACGTRAERLASELGQLQERISALSTPAGSYYEMQGSIARR
jgi:hypothetical protein